MGTRDFRDFPANIDWKDHQIQTLMARLFDRQNIDLMQELTSVASGDEIPVFDVSETGQVKTKKATVANIAAGAGAVIGPASATDNAVVRFDATTGKLAQNSAFLIDDSGYVSSFGGQITFPATQASSAGANTLDDYEEGTFTPTYASSGGGTPTYNTQYGGYTKIGNRALVTIRVLLTDKGTLAAGNLSIEGLPFTVENIAGNVNSWAISGNQFAAGINSLTALSINNTTTVTPLNFAAGTQTQLTVANINATNSINLSSQYRAA